MHLRSPPIFTSNVVNLSELVKFYSLWNYHKNEGFLIIEGGKEVNIRSENWRGFRYRVSLIIILNIQVHAGWITTNKWFLYYKFSTNFTYLLYYQLWTCYCLLKIIQRHRIWNMTNPACIYLFKVNPRTICEYVQS